MSHSKDLLRELPSVDRLLNHARSASLLARFNREYVARQCREVLNELRSAIRQGASTSATLDGLTSLTVDPELAERVEEASILTQVERKIELERESKLGRVVNATARFCTRIWDALCFRRRRSRRSAALPLTRSTWNTTSRAVSAASGKM